MAADERSGCHNTVPAVAARALSLREYFGMTVFRLGRVLALAATCHVYAQSSGAAKLTSGKDIYQAGCAGCHGKDGKGAPQSTIGFEKPDTFPDFTRCDQTTPEDNWTWKSIIRDGGPSRGFSQIMPSFSGALTSEQMDAVIGYLRGFCKETGWPRGELNLPLALMTEKAFPEDEEVVFGTVNVQGAPGVSSQIVHEQRFGQNNQIEVAVPVQFVRPRPGLWYGGFGDVGLGLKRVVFSNLHTGSILSLFGGANFPTGSTTHGLGAGTTTFETFAAFGQLFPTRTFLQLQGGADLPVDTKKSPQSVFFRSALGQEIAQKKGLGRTWSPMVELVSSRDLVDHAKTNWDVIPEMQVTLSRRQHVRFGAGLSIPATNTDGRQKQLLFYILWDWQDGRLMEGW